MKRLVAFVLALSLFSASIVSASADDGKITTQPYVSVLSIKELRAKGYDGAGVKVALLDANVDTSVPELAGADITNKSFCSAKAEPSEVAHGTSLMMMLASPDYGWVPKAKFTVYEAPHGKGGSASNLPEDCRQLGNTEMLQEALNDRNDIVLIAQGAVIGEGAAYPYAVARAALRGVPVVVAVGNESHATLTNAALANGSVAVGASSLEGKPLTLSNTGPGLTIMAPGEKTTIRDPDANGQLTRTREVAATSVSAPHVAGMLAMAKGKWPQANGNQLIRTMLDNVVTGAKKWDPAYGYGNMNPVKTVETDPTGQPTTNPLMDKTPGGNLTPQDLADYQDGLVTNLYVRRDKDYIFRGDSRSEANGFPPEQVQLNTSPRYKGSSPTPSRGTSAGTSSQGTQPSWWLWGGVFAAIVVMGTSGLAIWWVGRRRRTQSAGSR